MAIEPLTDTLSGMPQTIVPAQQTPGNSRYPFAIAIFGMAILSAFGFGYYSRPESPRLSATDLEFGESWAVPDFQWVMNLVNSGDQDVQITRFQSTCHCTSIAPETVVIPAGKSVPITLHLDLTPSGAQDLITPARPFEVSITAIVSGTGASQEPWLVKGAVRPSFVASHQEVRFPHLLVQGEPFESSSVTLRPQVKAQRVHASCESDLATTALHTLPGDAFALEVTPSTRLPVGWFSIPIAISIDDEFGQSLPDCTIIARGEVVSDIYALPSTIDYSIVPLGTRVAQSITLQTHLGTEFRVVESTCQDAALHAHSSGDQMFATRQHVEVIGMHTRQGSYTSGVSISIETKDGERREVHIPVCGYVVSN